ncbi:hypothetical protein [Streptomyces sp. NPDC127190]|uniref:hypothetical protein n=1 Tax=unclassified Streptomyces TaxID=2593676 RepID=UPI003641D22F
MRGGSVRVVGAVLVAAGMVAGCAGGGGSPERHADVGRPSGAMALTAALVKVEDASARAHTARVVETRTVGGAQPSRMSGVMDWSHGVQGNFTLTRPTSTAIRTARFEFRRDAIYMRVPADFSAMAGGKHWLKTPMSAIAAQSPVHKAQVDSMRQADPTLSVRLLIASGDVDRVGTQRVGGAATTHYTGTLDVDRMAALRGRGLSPEDAAHLKEDLVAQGVRSARVDLWVDGDDLVVKRQVRMRTAAGERTTVVRYSDYGVAVDLSVPRPSDTTLLPPAADQRQSAGRG